MFKSETTSFPLLFPKDSESLRLLDIQLWEVWAKRRLNGTSKVNKRTDGQTERRKHRRSDILTYRKHQPRGPMLWKYKISSWMLKLKCRDQLIRNHVCISYSPYYCKLLENFPFYSQCQCQPPHPSTVCGLLHAWVTHPQGSCTTLLEVLVLLLVGKVEHI